MKKTKELRDYLNLPGIKGNWDKMIQIKLAYQDKNPKAVPFMLDVKDDWEKMFEIRLAYRNGVSEAVPDMLKVKDDWKKMEEIRINYENKKIKKH